MATSHLEKSQLRILFQTGIDPVTQEPIFRRRSFNNIRINATPAELKAVANSLASLQQYELYKVKRVDQAMIIAD